MLSVANIDYVTRINKIVQFSSEGRSTIFSLLQIKSLILPVSHPSHQKPEAEEGNIVFPYLEYAYSYF